MPNKKTTKKPRPISPVHACSYEVALRSCGFGAVCGVDEAGRGPLAGPVVAAAAILPPGCDIEGITDSKKLTAARRETAFEKITRDAIDYCIATVSAEDVDRINILQASLLAMKNAVLGLTRCRPDFLLIDGRNTIAMETPQLAIIKGDFRSVSIAAASILAKVERDRRMLEYDKQHPGYGFARHKGYGTAEHVACLHKLGLCDIHRKTFGPVRALLTKTEQRKLF